MAAISITYPTVARLEKFLEGRKNQVLSYREVGDSVKEQVPNYDNDHYSILLGKGEPVWEAAKAALHRWAQFPEGWTSIYPAKAPLRQGQTVAVIFRVMGIWWINSARIIYTLDEPNRFGFAYGTVKGHVEKGEECFWIERNSEGEISYHIRAFSRPNYWWLWLVYPLARSFQRRFGRESTEKMRVIAKLS